jgi:hypothetical protein
VLVSPARSDAAPGTKRVLDVQDRVSEVIFGVITALTFTGSLSVAQSGQDDVRAMLIAALGCNTAWGIIDGVFYLLGRVVAKGRDLETLRAVRRATDPASARQLILSALPPAVGTVLSPDGLESIREGLVKLPEPPEVARIEGEDWLGALAVFLLVFFSMFPLALPFFLVDKTNLALRLSNAIALFMLAIAGAAYGRAIHRSPWRFGAAMVLVGALLVAVAIALGG